MNENPLDLINDLTADARSNPMVRTPTTVTRRRLLQMLGVTSAAGASALFNACSSSDASVGGKTTTKQNPTKKPNTNKSNKSDKPGGGSNRTLIVLELGGGHDGFAMHVPYGDAAFRKLRDRVWIDPKDLHVIDDRFAISKGLAPVADRLSFVEGVGVSNPSLSHFDMLVRWWQGNSDGALANPTGFLGRCCDVLMKDEPLTAVSLGGGATPTLITNKATTVALPALDATREFAKDEPENRRLREAVSVLGRPTKSASGIGNGDSTDRWLNIARGGIDASLDLTAMVSKLGELPASYPKDNPIASSLGMARQLVSLNAGIRIIHVPWGSFDTHSNQNSSHVSQMEQLGAGLAAFAKDLDEQGLRDRVLLATTSEFGRRPEANESGTDHGTASTMMLMGPAKPGRHGTPPNFKQRDPEGNVKATGSMIDYYATLAAWLGINPSDVLPKGAKAMDFVAV